ncbi:hypothetical protein Ddye_017652 [Dipteronia dyeriana]|uniref:Chitinase n=1 Tax=Dipteronia dyeriana TaxID=168575 RepID=A0AAD9X161_9ROSI|nr:hypothetical protein Ddye_017652 [Dipteronia dyeriana]
MDNKCNRPSVSGTPTGPEAASAGGYILPDALASEVLPTIKKSPEYGGVILWSSEYDKGYSSAIKINLENDWRWTSNVTDQVFLGLPAVPEPASSGYMEPNVFVSEVLPPIKSSPEYGGVMLWSSQYDKGYSSAIKVNV